MSLPEPTADMLTRIRNASRAGREMVEMAYSNRRGELARILKREGFVNDYAVEGGARKTLRIYLKYREDGTPAICGIRMESRPGLRVYRSVGDLPRVLGGLGTAIMSTSSGIMTAREAKKKGVGGEYVCSVW